MKDMTVPKKHLFSEEDLPLYELGYIFSDCSAWFETGMQNKVATFDLFIRDRPKNRNFLVFSGIEEVVSALKKWSYSEEDVNHLLGMGVITKEFGEYLKKFKFTGDIYAMPEGTIFFPGEPVIRVTAPLIEANLIGAFLVNVFSSNTIFASKAIRSVIAAKDKVVIGTISHRSHSFESSMKCARASFMVGATGGTAMPAFSKKYNLDIKEPSINLACHAFITSYPNEITAMRNITKLFKNNIALMVDTYGFEQGLKNAIKVGVELKEKGENLFGIMLDSGDIEELSIKARTNLDAAGLEETLIIAAGNMDEYKIDYLIKKNAPINSFVAVTEIANVCDDPKVESVYKLAELCDGNDIKYCAKFSPGKQTYPGKKQVFRVYEDDLFSKDIIGLDTETLGKALLIPAIKNGKTVYNPKSLWEIREFVKEQLTHLPKNLLSIEKEEEYGVDVSDKIKKLTDDIRNEHVL